MTKEKKSKESELQTCGIIMPISAIDSCATTHWDDVKEIISKAIESAGLKPNLVSDADDAGVIQKRIVQNIYDNEIIVCDVSCKNPNVMFELGMRLAFDKPTVIIMDDKTSFAFDTSVIEHIIYPRDLHYQSILDFKDKLRDKITKTLEASSSNNYTTFLKHFREIKPSKIEQTEGSINELMFDMLDNVTQKIDVLSRQMRRPKVFSRAMRSIDKNMVKADICLMKGITRDYITKYELSIDELREYLHERDVHISEKSLIELYEEMVIPF